MFCFASGEPACTGPPPTAAGGGGAPGAGPGPAGRGGVTPDIIIVPLNFEPPPAGLAGAAGARAVPQATHWVAPSVFGLPQLEQKTVTWLLRVCGLRCSRAARARRVGSPPSESGQTVAGLPASGKGVFVVS